MRPTAVITRLVTFTVTFALTLALLGAMAVSAPQETPARKAALGEKAPDFTLRDLDGRPHRLADYKGKVLVIEWTNPGCPFVEACYKAGIVARTIRQMKAMGRDYVYLAINSTARNRETAVTRDEVITQNRDFLKKHGVQMTVLVDHDGRVGKRFDARTTPHLYVIDREGVLRYHGAYTGDPGGADPKARNHVLEALEQIRAGESVSPEYVRPWGCRIKYAETGSEGG